MAATNFTPISLYYSATAAAVPTSGNLVAGELALNTVDGKLYYKNSAGTVTLLASTSGASGDVVGPASATDNALARFDLTTGKLIQNSVGILSDTGILTGLTGITSSGSITFSSLTSGRVTFASTAGLLADSANLVFDGTNVGIGNTSPTSYNAAADNLVIGTSGNNGMTIVSGSTSSGYIMFADGTTGQQQYEGQITYDHTSNFMAFNTSGTERMRISSTGLTVTLGATIQGLTVGLGAGAVSTNTAVGLSAISGSNTGANNTAVGWEALKVNTSGAANVAIGRSALAANLAGTSNSALGVGALLVNQSGSYNTAVGNDALVANTTASNNTAVGYKAGYTNQTGTRSVLLGANAGLVATALDGDVHIGYAAGQTQSTGFANTLVGGRGNVSNNSGAGFSLTSGTYNTFIGGSAGSSVDSGSKNTILGNYSGNQGGLDIRTSSTSNSIVLSDGDGNPRLAYLNNANPSGWYTYAGFFQYSARQLSPTSGTNYDMLTGIPAATWLVHISVSGIYHGGYAYIVRTYDSTDKSITFFGGGGTSSLTVTLSNPSSSFNSGTMRVSLNQNADAMNITMMPLAG